MKHIIILLDISYSMKKHSNKMIRGINQCIENLKQIHTNETIYFTLMLFSHTQTYFCKKIPIHDVQSFTQFDIPLYGMTHLYDAMSSAMKEWVTTNDDITNMFVITDGKDNKSRTTDLETVNEMCDVVTRLYGWEITHCGTDTSALRISDSINDVRYEVDDLENLLQGLGI